MNKLTNETLFDAIGELDEDLIAEARETSPAKKTSRFPLRRAMSLAACFAAVFAVSALLLISPLSLSDKAAEGEVIDAGPSEHESPGPSQETGLDFSHEKNGSKDGEKTAEEAAEPIEKVPEETYGAEPHPTADTKSAERIEAADAEKSAEPGKTDGKATEGKKRDDAPTYAEDSKNGTDGEWLKIGIAAGIAALVTAIFMISTKKRNGKER